MSAAIKLANNRIRFDGDLIVDEGQLGIGTTIGGTVTSIDLATFGRYFASYFINAGTITSSTLTLPPISSAGVSIGWRARIYYVFASTSTVGVGGSQTVIINDSTSTLVYTLNSSIFRGPVSVGAGTLIPFTVTAIGPGVNNWLIEVETPNYGQNGNLNNYSTNGGVLLKPFAQLGKLVTVGANTTNINVLFSAPVPIAFNTAPAIVPSLTFFRDVNILNMTATTVNFVRSGSFFLDLRVDLTAAGGATTINCQFAVRLNGTTILPHFCINTTNVLSVNAREYVLRCYFTANVGDFIEILGGRSATTGGTLIVNNTTNYLIYCLGT